MSLGSKSEKIDRQQINSRTDLSKCIPESFSKSRWWTIVSSHDNRWLEWSSTWKMKLDAILRWCMEENVVLVSSEANPSGKFVLHAARQRGLRRIVVRNESADGNVELSVTSPIQDELEVHLSSSEIGLDIESRTVDEVMMTLSDRVFAIHVRTGGRIDQSLRKKLVNQTLSKEDVFLVGEDQATLNAELGTVLWLPKLSATSNPSHKTNSVVSSSKQLTQVAFPSRLSNRINLPGHYLVHCTRGRCGPWPDQSATGFQSEWWESDLQNGSDSRSPLNSLKRILQQQRLIATAYLKQDSIPSVSFSAVCLHELLARRKFQRHLSRWDWEPYGICIETKWMSDQGANPVKYTDDKWSSEQEWRINSDVRLATIPPESACVFVPSEKEAFELAPISRFPVMILESFIASA